jgi:hypothetical protein
MIVWLSKKYRAIKTTQKTNRMMERVVAGLTTHQDQWRLIEYGRYTYKPALARALCHIAGFKSDHEVHQLIAAGKVTLNRTAVKDPTIRLGCGGYTVHLAGLGEYRFHIR